MAAVGAVLAIGCSIHSPDTVGRLPWHGHTTGNGRATRGAAVSGEELELGPVDIVAIGFPPGAPQTGESIPIFVDLVDRGIIRVLDVLMVRKDAGGVVSGIEIADLDGDGLTDLAVFEGARSGMLGDEDANLAGQALAPGEAAVLICFENTWAAPFVTSVRRNGGNVLAFQRVPAQEVLDIVDALDAVDAAS
jgi:Family of unknown function (DUF6325)